jgi:hypothetical protein
MHPSNDYSISLVSLKISPDVVFKQSGKNLTILILDDSDSYFNFESYPAEIWLALNEGVSPSEIFNKIKNRDNLPEDEFKKDFNQFLNYLKDENLILD